MASGSTNRQAVAGIDAEVLNAPATRPGPGEGQGTAGHRPEVVVDVDAALVEKRVRLVAASP